MSEKSGAAISIRHATADDLPHFEFPMPWHDRAVRADERVNAWFMSSLVLVACDGDDIVGWVFAVLSRREDGALWFYLFFLTVAESHRGAGIGTRLMQTVEDAATALGLRGVTLGVDKLNTRAAEWYARRGYQACGAREFDMPCLRPDGTPDEIRCTETLMRRAIGSGVLC